MFGPGSWWEQSPATCFCATARPRRLQTAWAHPTQVQHLKNLLRVSAASGSRMHTIEAVLPTSVASSSHQPLLARMQLVLLHGIFLRVIVGDLISPGRWERCVILFIAGLSDSNMAIQGTMDRCMAWRAARSIRRCSSAAVTGPRACGMRICGAP